MAGLADGALSVDAIARASARISLLFCGTAVLSLPFALRDGGDRWGLRAALVLVALVSCFAVAVQAFVRGGGTRWAPATMITLCLSTALVSASTDVLRPEAAHQIVSWTNAGVGGALAFSFGARWGVAALVLGMTTAFGVEHLTGGVVAPDNIIGPLTYVAGSSLARGAAFRGDTATERALTAKESAEAALRVAEDRWEAARTAQRELHDTVLATLTMLAHRGQGVPAEAVVRAAVRDTDLLRRGVVVRDPPDPPARLLVTDPRGVVVRPGVRLRHVVEAAIGDGRVSGFGIRVHAAGRAYETTRLSAPVAAALRHALRECLWNARQHSDVQAADVTVIVDDGQVSVIVLDEGRGFEPGAVPEDRLGLRDSVSSRLADVGGRATIWSGPGLGTSILLAVPGLAPPRDPCDDHDGDHEPGDDRGRGGDHDSDHDSDQGGDRGGDEGGVS